MRGSLGYVGSCVDITEHIKLEHDLKMALGVKSDFLALMSHEIRTPLVSLMCCRCACAKVRSSSAAGVCFLSQATVIGMAELMADVPLMSELHEVCMR